MKIQTFSIVAGSEACNAQCPYCISRMTPPSGIELKEPEVNWRNFRKASNLAKMSGTTTAMITSKGEPTLFPDQITKYLEAMEEFEFPFIELQTNGIPLWENREKYDAHLSEWYDKGLNTIAISVVHYDSEKNREVFLPNKDSYINLEKLVNYLHEKKYSVRLSCVMLDGYIDSPEGLEKLIGFAKENKVEQLTIRPMNKPDKSENQKVYDWTEDHLLSDEKIKDIGNYLEKNGTRIMTLQHGAIVYDVGGQNICNTDCLTIKSNSEDIRQLIFFPDGHLRYDWQYEGAILL